MIKIGQELYDQVETSLDSIRPYLKADGGDIEVVEITDEMVVKVRLLGACESCPMSFMTMKAGVEESIKSAIPEIKGIETVSSTN
jgi:Fe-S cluster biogenesis protein NfuA